MSDEFHIVCPNCGNKYELSLFDRKKELICPLCGHLIDMVRKDTEVIVKAGDIPKQILLSSRDLENSPELVEEVEKDLADMRGMDILERFYALEELIARYLEDVYEEGKVKIAKAIIASKIQIEMAPAVKEYLQKHNKGLPLPVHIGYATLSEIRERQGLYEEAIKLCQQAYSEGWAGDWTDRISRCKKTSVYRRDK